MTLDELFTDCPREPVWSDFTAFELVGFYRDGSTEIDARQATFFAVFGRRRDGFRVSISTTQGAVNALHLAAAIGRRSGIPVSVHSSLAVPRRPPRFMIVQSLRGKQPWPVRSRGRVLTYPTHVEAARIAQDRQSRAKPGLTYLATLYDGE